MLEAVGSFILGLVLLALGGDSIVKGASGLAQRVGASSQASRRWRWATRWAATSSTSG